MLERKIKVPEHVREQKQSDRRCERGKAKLPRMFGRKTKSQRKLERKTKPQRMLERKRKVTKDLTEKTQSYRG